MSLRAAATQTWAEQRQFSYQYHQRSNKIVAVWLLLNRWSQKNRNSNFSSLNNKFALQIKVEPLQLFPMNLTVLSNTILKFSVSWAAALNHSNLRHHREGHDPIWWIPLIMKNKNLATKMLMAAGLSRSICQLSAKRSRRTLQRRWRWRQARLVRTPAARPIMIIFSSSAAVANNWKKSQLQRAHPAQQTILKLIKKTLNVRWMQKWLHLNPPIIILNRCKDLLNYSLNPTAHHQFWRQSLQQSVMCTSRAAANCNFLT